MTGPTGRRVLRFDSGFAADFMLIALTGDEHEVSVTGPALPPFTAITDNANRLPKISSKRRNVKEMAP